jgi:large subunit ribosomal protein L4
MPEVMIRNLKNEEVRKLDLPDAVFSAPLKEHLVYEAVHHYRAEQRAGSASTKTRGEVSGSGRKLWRQKKTGRARVGSIRSPLWRTGGTVHGPRPRDYGYAFPRKMRQGALRSVLSERLREGRLLLVDQLSLASHRTKEFLPVLSVLGLEGASVLVVDERGNRNLELAARNLQSVELSQPFRIQTYDVLAHEYLLITEAAASRLAERLSR